MAFCSAALLGPGGRALGLMGFPFGIQREGPTLSTPSSGGGTVATVEAEARGCGGCCCCSTANIKPWLRIRALTGLSGIFPSFIPPVEAVSEGAMGADGGSDGVVVEEADMVTTVVAEAVAEL